MIYGYREVERIAIREAQRIPYVIARQDPLVLGPEARDVSTTLRVFPGDIVVVYRKVVA